MKIVYNWLKEFVEATAPADELRAKLSLAGVAIDSIEETPAGPVLDAEITANRPDCLGHYGVAREVAAIYRLPVKSLKPKLKEASAKAADATRVEIEAPELCGRYTARVLRGVKVQPSPDWLRQRLEAIGQNSINNVVDVTNYVMFELGQPLHAFDLDKLSEKRIVVRRARAGEKIRTLDGGERTLAKEMCVIADAQRAVAIAGVMGGAESEIGFSSRNILIESAWFDPISVRRTSKALGLRTEASYRFERGADPEMAELASRRAAELIQQVAGGELLAGVVDVYPGRAEGATIELSRKELLRVMGADVPDRDVEEILGALGFHPVRKDAQRGSNGSLLAAWECKQPSWRQDVTRGIDLIEEVARHYGYDKFPPRLPPAKRPAERLPHATALDRLRERVIALGYQEIVAIPLVDARRDELFRAEGVAPAVIGNPLAEDASVMRSNGTVSMIDALEWNLNHGQRDLRLFEIGKTYQLQEGEPVERMVLTLGATGLAREKTIHEDAREFGFADLKGDLDSVGRLAAGFAWESGGPRWLAAGSATHMCFSQSHKGVHEGRRGVAGQLARRIADQLKLRQDVFIAELQLEPLLAGIETAGATRKFEPIPRFPAVERDFSLVLADGVHFAQVVDTIGALAIPELRGIQALDLFRGGQVPKGKFSLMIRVTFQSAEATLTDAQIAEFSSRIVGALETKLGAALRAS
ncbi:MAG TPA: phenylalanine--tRNA ligase subunit beta [Candidatus Acidoferrales bacterium]|jgi:phenylalanyl-tRNA synthetase beta chain|nr:phenylalanine--tRNA ligase subunit beta [Candidatus Acidoferrales bacterium]